MAERNRPQFEDLALNASHPKASAWGLWGDDDEKGTLNLITNEVVVAAKQEIQTGKAISLNLPLNVPSKPMNPARKRLDHKILVKEYANDDEIHINTQSSSQWDSLRHYPYTEHRKFYNGATQEDFTGKNATEKLGIQVLAKNPIVTRGVLLDWYRFCKPNSESFRPFTNQSIPFKDLLEVASREGVTFRTGDVLLIRTGWLAEYLSLSPEAQDNLGGRDDRASIGVEITEESLRWHWKNEFAAVAGDTVAYEAWPSPKPWGVSGHEVFLSGWGMPIGEFFDLEALSEECERQQRWTFMFTSQPLHIPGGIASPPNAMAIF